MKLKKRYILNLFTRTLENHKGDVETAEVLDEGLAVLTDADELGELGLVEGGELDALLLGELDDGLGADGAVEVEVELRLGESLHDVEGDELLGGDFLRHFG